MFLGASHTSDHGLLPDERRTPRRRDSQRRCSEVVIYRVGTISSASEAEAGGEDPREARELNIESASSDHSLHQYYAAGAMPGSMHNPPGPSPLPSPEAGPPSLAPKLGSRSATPPQRPSVDLPLTLQSASACTSPFTSDSDLKTLAGPVVDPQPDRPPERAAARPGPASPTAPATNGSLSESPPRLLQ